MLVGLQGSGKTTTIGKLALLLRKKYKKNPLLVACDVYRPAAIDQLKQLGKQLNIEVYEEGKKDPVEISNNAINYAKENNFDYVLIDTAGRLQNKFNLMEELSKIECIKEVRGKGLMIGMEFDQPIKDIRRKLLFEEHVFTGVSGTNVIRLLPPLTLTMAEAEEFITRFKRVLA